MASGGAGGLDVFGGAFGLVKEIVSFGSAPEQTPFRELVARFAKVRSIDVTGTAPNHLQMMQQRRLC